MYFYLHNEHSDIVNLVDEENSVKNKYEYDVFGDVTVSEESVENEFKYYEQQLDTTTQLYYLRARYYDPRVGRFTQEDIYRGDGLNLYAYVKNNPIMWVDPSGYMAHDPNAKDVGRNGALNEAKRDANISKSTQPDKVETVPMRTAEYEGGNVIKDDNGNIIYTREYHYTNNNGEHVVIQDHSAGHKKGGQGPHVNVRPPENTRTGSFGGTKDHYPFNK